jgi:hypothetical protein
MSSENLELEVAGFAHDPETAAASYGYRLDRCNQNVMSPEIGQRWLWWWTLSIARDEDIVSERTWASAAEAKADMLRDFQARQDTPMRA